MRMIRWKISTKILRFNANFYTSNMYVMIPWFWGVFQICDIIDHGMFLEWWNTTKSLSNIWQCFSCLLGDCQNVEEIVISWWLFELCTCKYQSSPSDSTFFHALVCSQKPIVRMLERLFVVFQSPRNIPCNGFQSAVMPLVGGQVNPTRSLLL